MIQEIITYMILGAAITLAIIKVRNRFWHKKRKISNQNNEKSSSLPNCSACSAECVMRDISPQTTQYNKDLCNKIELN
jgi:large-conductance mechanosensitive channel